MSKYNIVAAMSDSTVAAEYEPSKRKSDAYQSEEQLEKEFIRLLGEQGYIYLNIHEEKDLVNNLRVQLEKLNNITFSEKEWDTFYHGCIANSNEGIVEKTRKIQSDYIQVLKRDDGTSKNVYLLDKDHIHNNYLQVINQYEETGGKHDTRYDVTILVNGLPLVHIELKKRGVLLREAFNQIKRYQRDSFWASCGLYEYVQVFVISNGTNTKYYSNTTRNSAIKEQASSNRNQSKKTSNSYEFTSFWADESNKIIPDLVDFTKTFFAKHVLLNILTRYCVFTSEELLLVMRPYQIAATEKILNRIEISNNYKKMGSVEGGGYIWHTTGSGKTLTSFKTSQLATSLPYIDKVLFVVDRKDLDYQTMKEYDRFEKGAANSSASTSILERQLRDDNGKIIITTIQKLDTFIRKFKSHEIYNKHVVLIFDECHRSQFGDMHTRITKYFKNYHIFGFTGTPISTKNAGAGKNPNLKTTKQAFGDCLHTYTIVNAINDGNVLPFRIDYINTIKEKSTVKDEKVMAIDTEAAMLSSERIKKIVEYTLDHFDQKTKRNDYYSLKGQRVNGFNSIFATSSIPASMKYYEEFKKQLNERNKKLNIALIYSYSINEDDPEDIITDEDLDTSNLDNTSRDFLDLAIDDYNNQFHTNYDTSSNNFENYYKDISQRMKNRELDLLIVVNMFLTGFDATTLNTLWVDKNLRYHGLLQAFSRTNRILNSVKTFGNIICFRNLQQATEDAISLFGDGDITGIVLLKDFDSYMNGYDENGKHYPGYRELINELLNTYPVAEPIEGEKWMKKFVALFGAILKMRNILNSFDQFEGNDIISPRDMQDYQSKYLDIYHLIHPVKVDAENINDDVVFEIELIKQVEVNIDYILMLIKKYHDDNCEDKTIVVDIKKAIDASPDLRSKKQLIERFLERINASSEVDRDWQTFVKEQKDSDLKSLISKENLNSDEAIKLMNNSFRDGYFKTTGTDIDKVLPPVSRFASTSSGDSRIAIKERVISALQSFFEKYFGLI